MAKSGQRQHRRPHHHDRNDRGDRNESRTPQNQPIVEPELQNEPTAQATAVAAPPALEAAPKSEDVSSIDAETNAKYEQVKGGKLYIKDLQQMDTHALHEIAKEENIQDFIGFVESKVHRVIPVVGTGGS